MMICSDVNLIYDIVGFKLGLKIPSWKVTFSFPALVSRCFFFFLDVGYVALVRWRVIEEETDCVGRIDIRCSQVRPPDQSSGGKATFATLPGHRWLEEMETYGSIVCNFFNVLVFEARPTVATLYSSNFRIGTGTT